MPLQDAFRSPKRVKADSLSQDGKEESLSLVFLAYSGPMGSFEKQKAYLTNNIDKVAGVLSMHHKIMDIDMSSVIVVALDIQTNNLVGIECSDGLRSSEGCILFQHILSNNVIFGDGIFKVSGLSPKNGFSRKVNGNFDARMLLNGGFYTYMGSSQISRMNWNDVMPLGFTKDPVTYLSIGGAEFMTNTEMQKLPKWGACNKPVFAFIDDDKVKADASKILVDIKVLDNSDSGKLATWVVCLWRTDVMFNAMKEVMEIACEQRQPILLYFLQRDGSEYGGDIRYKSTPLTFASFVMPSDELDEFLNILATKPSEDKVVPVSPIAPVTAMNDILLDSSGVFDGFAFCQSLPTEVRMKGVAVIHCSAEECNGSIVEDYCDSCGQEPSGKLLSPLSFVLHVPTTRTSHLVHVTSYATANAMIGGEGENSLVTRSSSAAGRLRVVNGLKSRTQGTYTILDGVVTAFSPLKP